MHTRMLVVLYRIGVFPQWLHQIRRCSHASRRFNSDAVVWQRGARPGLRCIWQGATARRKEGASILHWGTFRQASIKGKSCRTSARERTTVSFPSGAQQTCCIRKV